jgi:glycosyltransferase involved in cell wall biosynthesis
MEWRQPLKKRTSPGFVLPKTGKGTRRLYRPLVSVIVPAYNEAAILRKNLTTLCHYLESLENEYRWELFVINDGSTDNTGELAEEFARTRPRVRVLHHIVNFGLGQAFQSAFNASRADYLVTLDLDLSYTPDHIGALLRKLRDTRAKVVVASPYMEGGQISHVPPVRRFMSIWANRFLSRMARGNMATLTGMVRAYDGKFVRSLDLRSTGMEINPEVLYKAALLHARVEEIPAHLDWGLQKAEKADRRSSMRMLRHTFAVLIAGFLFRPVLFFLLPGATLSLLALYADSWIILHVWAEYQKLAQHSWFLDRASHAAAAAYQQFPHTFIIGGLASMLAIQLLSLGTLALQSKHYFEEVFHLGTSLYRFVRGNERSRV